MNLNLQLPLGALFLAGVVSVQVSVEQCTLGFLYYAKKTLDKSYTLV